jgi:two-component system sensor histidine kinase UhpB
MRHDELRVADPALRRALARELHDRVAQTLTAILIDLENFKSEQAGRDSVRDRVDSVQGSMREVLSSLRDLVHELRGDAVGAVEDFREALATLIRDFERRTGIASSLVVHPGWPAHIRPAAAFNLYRIAEEALANAARHSGAMRVSVRLRRLPGNDLSMSITDYGRGFDDRETAPGMGTLGMKERAVLIGARLWLDSFPGYGTSVHVVAPVSVMSRSGS